MFKNLLKLSGVGLIGVIGGVIGAMAYEAIVDHMVCETCGQCDACEANECDPDDEGFDPSDFMDDDDLFVDETANSPKADAAVETEIPGKDA